MNIRVSELEDDHRALGAGLDDWNDMDVAWSYASNPEDEHDAVREAAGLFDVSALKKIWITGPDALAAIQRIATRDMSRIPIGKSAYNPLLTDEGTISDDNIIFHVAENKYLYVHGTGNSFDVLEQAVEGLDAQIAKDDELHDLSLQGPKSVAVLNPHCDADLESIEYFHQVHAKLFGKDVLISRTGYSGERGFEIFVDRSDVAAMWSDILEAGKDAGVMPCSFTCLDKIRIEAALLFYPYDINEQTTPWEVGLGWSISRKKGEFKGSKALFASEGKDKQRFAGVSADTSDLLDDQAKLMLDGEVVGQVNSPGYSHRLGRSLGLCHIRPDIQTGTVLQNVGPGGSVDVVVDDVPYHDPKKSRTHA